MNHDKWVDLDFAVKRSIRYHNHRRKFFDTWDVVAKFLVIATGTTVVGLASATSSGDEGHHVWTISVGAFTAIIGSLDLVIGFSRRARDYRDLVRDFSQLEREISTVGEKREEDNYVKFLNRRLEIEENEPPVKRVLDCYCHNEVARSLGWPDDEMVKISFWQRLFMQWFDIAAGSLKKNCEANPPQNPILPTPAVGQNS